MLQELVYEMSKKKEPIKLCSSAHFRDDQKKNRSNCAQVLISETYKKKKKTADRAHLFSQKKIRCSAHQVNIGKLIALQTFYSDPSLVVHNLLKRLLIFDHFQVTDVYEEKSSNKISRLHRLSNMTKYIIIHTYIHRQVIFTFEKNYRVHGLVNQLVS